MKDKAINILERLAEGVDPVTGEVFGSDTCFSNVDVIRAIVWATNELRATKTARPQPMNAGTKWTIEEEDLLRERFRNGSTVAELSALHNRTRGAINNRLEKMGLVASKSLTGHIGVPF